MHDNDDRDRQRQEIEYYRRQVDEQGSRAVRGDFVITALRRALEQKRAGFALLSELEGAFDPGMPVLAVLGNVLASARSALAMDRAMYLAGTDDGSGYVPRSWHGFTESDTERIAAAFFTIPPEHRTTGSSLIVNKATAVTPFIDEMRRVLGVPFFIAMAVQFDAGREGMLIVGRLQEKKPFYQTLDQGDVDTLQAIVGFLATHVRNQSITELRAFEQVLRNTMPYEIALRLKNGERHIADVCPAATVMFADIVSFTTLAEELPATELVALLTDLFSRFDALAATHGVEKIKTIGDSYMAVAGLPTARPDHAIAAARMAGEMLAVVRDLARDTGHAIQIRVGLHSGPVIAGVIGAAKYAYDVWGNTVNIASRMESHGVPGAVHLSETTAALLLPSMPCTARGTVTIKGMGSMNTFLLDTTGARM